MKKALFLISIFLVAVAAKAQPVITSAINPVVGDVFYAHGCDPTGVTPGPSGASVTWNFSTLTVSVLDTLRFVACASTPYCDSFPGANVVALRPGYYNYFATSATAFANLGIYQPGYSGLYYTNPENILEYPITYNTTYTDTVIGTDPTNSEYTQSIDTTIADGYGTLQLPGITYTNVLRVHQISHNVDSFAGTLPYAARSRGDRYMWLTASTHLMLLNMTIDQPSTGLPLVDLTYYQSTPTAVPGIGSQPIHVSVSPNPAYTNFTLSFYTADAANTHIDLLDITGRSIAITHGSIVDGANNIYCTLPPIAPGLYTIRIYTPTGIAIQKISIN